MSLIKEMNLFPTSRSKINRKAVTDKCIVLDLDQTIVATQDFEKDLARMKILTDPNLMELRKRTYNLQAEDSYRNGSGVYYKFWGVTRPHTDEFLIFCFNYFDWVTVWSAGQPTYVDALVHHLFKDLKKPNLVLNRRDCEEGKDGIIKPLSKIFHRSNYVMNEKNTFALDDTKSTFSSNLGNGILIPAYQPDTNKKSLSEDDTRFYELQEWLNRIEVRESKDVRELDKNKIFF